MARISTGAVEQFWFSDPLRSFSGVFLLLERHRKFATPRRTNPRKARNECTVFSQRNGINTVRNHKEFLYYVFWGATGSLAPRCHSTEDAKPLLPAFAFISCTNTTLPLPYPFKHTVSLYYIVSWHKNLTQVISYEHLRCRKHLFHDHRHAACTAWPHVGCTLYDSRTLPVCKRNPIFEECPSTRKN